MLLDSGVSAERGRYDLLSAWPLEQLAMPDSGSLFLQRLRDNLSRLGELILPVGLSYRSRAV